MAKLDSLEKKLDDVLNKKAPFQLPENGRKAIVEYMPWINLVLGVLTLYAAWSVWHWAHLANAIVDYANSLSQSLGGTMIESHRLTAMLWLGIIVLVVEGLLFIAAFPGTRDRKKSGWNLLFYASLVNIFYGMVILFTAYGGFGHFVSSLLASVIGLYFLFQIREFYLGRRASTNAKGKS